MGIEDRNGKRQYVAFFNGSHFLNVGKKGCRMAQKTMDLRLVTEQIRPALCRATVVVNKKLVSNLYNQSVLSQQKTVRAHGFQRGAVPLEYIKQNFSVSIADHLKEFLFHYFE